MGKKKAKKPKRPEHFVSTITIRIAGAHVLDTDERIDLGCHIDLLCVTLAELCDGDCSYVLDALPAPKSEKKKRIARPIETTQPVEEANAEGNQDKHECGNCDAVWKEDDLVWPIPDYFERVEPGGVVPSGECPDCGALCYPNEPKDAADCM